MVIAIAAALGAAFGVISSFYKKAFLYLIIIGGGIIGFGDKFGLSVMPKIKTNRINLESVDDFFLDIWHGISYDGRWAMLVFPLAAIFACLVVRFLKNVTAKEPGKLTQARKREVLKGYNL